MTKPTIPDEAIEPDFIAILRDRYVAREPTALRLQLAIDLVNDLGRSYLDQALSYSCDEIRSILLGVLSNQPDEDEPDHRGPAGLLFLHGVATGYWTATADETELASALVIATYGLAAVDALKPERTKTDLAREAGLPVSDFTYMAPDTRTSKQIIADYLSVQQLSDRVELIAARTPVEFDALGIALKDFLDALKRHSPTSYERQVCNLRRTLAPAAAKFYIGLSKRHDEQSQR